MRCARCSGLMVRERFEDLQGLGSGHHEYAGWRCINCGAIVDQLRDEHRLLTSQVAASNPTLLAVSVGSRARPAEGGDQHGDPMRPDDHSIDTEAGVFSASWWRRDSARRLPLR